MRNSVERNGDLKFDAADGGMLFAGVDLCSGVKNVNGDTTVDVFVCFFRNRDGHVEIDKKCTRMGNPITPNHVTARSGINRDRRSDLGIPLTGGSNPIGDLAQSIRNKLF